MTTSEITLKLAKVLHEVEGLKARVGKIDEPNPYLPKWEDSPSLQQSYLCMAKQVQDYLEMQGLAVVQKDGAASAGALSSERK